MMKLWYLKEHDTSLAIRLLIYESELEVEERLLDPESALDQDAFRQITNLPNIPILQIPEAPGILHAVMDIAEYLSRQAPPERQMVPTDPEAGFQVRRWVYFTGTLLSPPISRARRGAEATSYATLTLALPRLEACLRDRDHVADDRFTFADCVLAVLLPVLSKLVEWRREYPTLAEYLERIRQRPAFQRL